MPVLLSLVSVAAQAQVLLRDDFETPVSALDAGVWAEFNTHPNLTMTVTAAAAHEGLGGLRVTDDGTGSAGVSGYLQANTTATGDRYLRFWFRPAALSRGGPAHVSAISGDIAGSTLIDAVYTPDAGTVVFGCMRRQGSSSQYAGAVGTASVAASSWHLVEYAALGVGSNRGVCAAWVDGVALAPITGINWNALNLTSFFVGEHYRDAPFTGSYDIDSVAVSVTAPASGLRFSVDGGSDAGWPVGACVPISLTLVNSQDAGPTAASSAITVPLTTGAGLTVALTCQGAPVSSVQVPVGVNSIALSAVASQSGIVQLQSQSIDLLNDQISLSIIEAPADAGLPDAGPPDGGASDAGVADGGVTQPPLSVGCGCQGAPSGLGWLTGLAILRRLVRQMRLRHVSGLAGATRVST